MDAPAPPAPPADAPIVVIAPRLPEAPGARAFSTFPIDQEALEQALRLDQALKIAPGVSLFRRSDSASANPTIQGLSVRSSGASGAGRTLVLLDGAPLNDPFGGWVIWGAVAPETLARADIVRGAGAGPYGAGALLGTIALQERDGAGFALDGETGQRGHWRGSGFGLGGDDTISLMLAAQAQSDDGYIPVRARRGAADAPLWFDSASAALRLGLRGRALAFSARLGGYAEERGAGLVGAQSRNTGQSLSLALARPTGAFEWRLQAWASASDLFNSSVSTALDRSSTTPANTQLSTPALGLGLNGALRWSNETSGLEIGADLRHADGETREVFNFSGGQFTRSRKAGGDALVYGAYAEAWRDTGLWLFSGGVRIDDWRAYDGTRIERNLATSAVTLALAPADNDVVAPTARLGLRHALDGGLYWRAAAYTGFRPPTLNELHRPFRVGNDVTEANPALDPERLYGVDAALGADGAHARWSLGVFATRLNDAIVNVTLGAGPGTFPPGVFVPAGGAFRQRQNAGAIEAFGVEAEATGDIGALAWRAALNATDSNMRGGPLDGLKPAQSPTWSASAGAAWRLASATTLSADLSYESARFDDDQNTRKLAAATVLDLRLDQKIAPVATLFAALDNAADAAVATAQTADGVTSLGPPRTFRIGVRIAPEANP